MKSEEAPANSRIGVVPELIVKSEVLPRSCRIELPPLDLILKSELEFVNSRIGVLSTKLIPVASL